jgi:hypothetical protein
MPTIGLDDQGYTVDLGSGGTAEDILVDADEAGLPESVTDVQALAEEVGDILVNFKSEVIAPTDSTKQNNYAPAGLADAREMRWSGTASTGITGLAAQSDGREIIVKNSTTDYLFWLEHESAASTAANRFVLPKQFPAFLLPGESLTLRYDGTASRWYVVSWPAQGVAMGLDVFSDFTGGSGGEFAGGFSGTGATVSATSDNAGSPEYAQGVFVLTMGTTTTGRANLGQANSVIVPAHGAALGVVRLRLVTAVDGTETYAVIAGFQDAVATWPDGVAWEYRWTGAAAEWSQSRSANSTPTRSNTGSPTPDTTYLWAVVFLNPAWTRADFIYSQDSSSFAVADSPTTGLPAAARTTGFGVSVIKSAGTTSRDVYVDFMGFKNVNLRG